MKTTMKAKKRESRTAWTTVDRRYVCSDGTITREEQVTREEHGS